MAYTVKQLLESKQFPDMRLVTCKENLNQEIKGIRIIEIEDMERYLTGGELLLTNMKVYFGETDREFRKHLNELDGLAGKQALLSGAAACGIGIQQYGYIRALHFLQFEGGKRLHGIQHGIQRVIDCHRNHKRKHKLCTGAVLPQKQGRFFRTISRL